MRKCFEIHLVHLSSSILLLLNLWKWAESNEKTWNRFESVQGSDSIQVTRCDVVCYHARDKKECHRTCMNEAFQKGGRCPDSFENLPVFVQACVYFCAEDSECPSTEKCCVHSCGQTCKPATDLLEDVSLPPIPFNLRARERKMKNGVRLTWDFDGDNNNKDGIVLFVLEERHHLGRFYNEPLLGEWSPIHSSKRTTVNLKNVIKPGYWYQFRVAAVNENGTKAFSRESEGFKLTKRPKLPQPTKLRVGQIKEKNGTIWGLVRWNPSDSFIPIQRYKIFWTHRIDNRNISYKSEDVLVEKDSVPVVRVESQLYYQLKNLRKNTDYFIQVQALALYGRNSLKSKMAKMLFKTYKMEDQFEMEDFK